MCISRIKFLSVPKTKLVLGLVFVTLTVVIFDVIYRRQSVDSTELSNPIKEKCIPKRHIWVNQNPVYFNMMVPPLGRVYEMVASHTNYDKRLWQRWLPADSINLAIIRHPLLHLQSCVYYIKYVSKYLPGDQNLKLYLENPSRYSEPGRPWAINLVPYEFNLPQARMKDIDFIRYYAKKLAKEFDLVMIMERFEESLVFMRRLLCWKLRDVVFLPLNVNNIKLKEARQLPVFLVNKHKSMAKGDYYLYNHFLKIFDIKVKREGPSFNNEVQRFKIINRRVRIYCDSNTEESLRILGSEWNEAFSVDKRDCEMMKYEDRKLVAWAHEVQYKDINYL